MNYFALFVVEWIQKRYPNETIESLSKETLAERLKRFYQELRRDENTDYSPSAHLSIRAGINRYLCSELLSLNIKRVRDF